jgi:hypothetical protein
MEGVDTYFCKSSMPPTIILRTGLGEYRHRVNDIEAKTSSAPELLQRFDHIARSAYLLAIRRGWYAPANPAILFMDNWDGDALDRLRR